MRSRVMAGVVGSILGCAGLAVAADGVGIRPLTCGPYVVGEVMCQIGSIGNQYRQNDARVEIIRREGYSSSKLNPDQIILATQRSVRKRELADQSAEALWRRQHGR